MDEPCACCLDSSRFIGSGEPPCPLCGHTVEACNPDDRKGLPVSKRPPMGDEPWLKDVAPILGQLADLLTAAAILGYKGRAAALVQAAEYTVGAMTPPTPVEVALGRILRVLAEFAGYAAEKVGVSNPETRSADRDKGAAVAYPLRSSGLYRWRGGLYQALDLSSPDQPWRAMGLMGHPFRQQHDDINYVRADGTIINVDFLPVGTIGDLEDTGEDA